MMKRLLLSFLVVIAGSQVFAVKHTIVNSGFTFSPASLTINLGDTIEFVLSPSHDARQVSLSTWTANDTTALPGGFEVPFGGGIVVPTSLGDIYYVCVPHASIQMKGRITVSQLGVENNQAVTMQILQSVSDSYIKLNFTGGNTGSISLEMMNLSGQIVKKMTVQLDGGSASESLFTGDLPKGVYMIRWSIGSVNRAKKIIL